MNTYILLLRGINVGGRNVLPMKELVALCETLGCRNVATYIQSGNVVLQCAKKTASELPTRLGKAIQKQRGFAPSVLLVEQADIERAITGNPYADAETEPKSLHVGFLESTPSKPDLKKLEDLKRASEDFKLKGKVFYLHAPEGIARSKLAAGIERALGATMTFRNWRTLCKLRDMAMETIG
ncbi:MAG: DUF1697 domain-containing protein [Phycisphaerales bacterium]|nr:DUF1697 domain-containing protein [Phycisphaerales bacterium]